MPINKSGLTTKVQTLTTENIATGSTSVDNVLSNALALNALSEINTITVPNVDSLPNLKYYSSPSGMVYYIESLSILVVSTGSGQWLGLDGRLVRNDSFYAEVNTWGANDGGALGASIQPDGIAGIFNSRSSPGVISGSFTDWCQVDSGRRNFAIRANGTLWAWGCNNYGSLGTGNCINCESSPVTVVGGFTDWCQVSSNSLHTLAVRCNGTLWAWGRNCRTFFGNNAGTLGNNDANPQSSPVSVSGGFTDWCQASAGFYHSLGLRSNGTAWSWGCNSNGELGTNNATTTCSPVSVVGGFTDWCRIGAGCRFSGGIRNNGTIWTWGANSNGNLGDNSTATRSSPVSVVGGFTDWCQLSVGQVHMIAIRTNGTAWSWGSNSLGNLGDNTTSSRSSPVSVVGGFTNWCCVCASSTAYRTSGVRTDGTAWAWGCGVCGTLGVNDINNRSSPTQIAGNYTDWSQVSTGGCISSGIRRRT